MVGTYADINYDHSSKYLYEYFNLPEIPKTSYGMYFGIGLEREVSEKIALRMDFKELVDFKSKDKNRTLYKFGIITYGFSFGVNVKI